MPASRVAPEQRPWESLLHDHAPSTLLPYQRAVHVRQLLQLRPSRAPILHLQPKVSTKLECPTALRYPTWIPGLPVQISASHSNTPQHVQGALRLERAHWALLQTGSLKPLSDSQRARSSSTASSGTRICNSNLVSSLPRGPAGSPNQTPRISTPTSCFLLKRLLKIQGERQSPSPPNLLLSTPSSWASGLRSCTKPAWHWRKGRRASQDLPTAQHLACLHQPRHSQAWDKGTTGSKTGARRRSRIGSCTRVSPPTSGTRG